MTDRSRGSPLAAWEIYQRELLKLCHGLPLWNPQPFPDTPEIECGSVVYFKSKPFGNITPLFNAMSHEPQDLPENFKCLELPPRTLVGPYPPFKTTCLSSRSMTTKEISVEAEAGGCVANLVTLSVHRDGSLPFAKRHWACYGDCRRWLELQVL